MRVRVLVTNGSKTADLFWVEHTGRDVYCGMVGLPDHYAYHETGARHIKQAGGYQILERHVPLAELRGIFQLTTLAFSSTLLDAGNYLRDYFGASVDAVVYLDTRSMSGDAPFLNVMVGLLEIGPPELLPIGVPDWVTRQIVLVTDVRPWVWIAVGWPVPKAEAPDLGGPPQTR